MREEIFSHVFIHEKSIGDKEACQKIKNKILTIVEDLYDKRDLEGYRMYIIENEEDAENRLVIFICEEFEELTDGVYPFFYMELHPLEIDEQLLDDSILELGFVRCA